MTDKAPKKPVEKPKDEAPAPAKKKKAKKKQGPQPLLGVVFPKN